MVTGVYGHQTRPHNLRHMSIDIEKNIEFLFRNMEDEIKERNRKRAEIWALKSFRDRSTSEMEGEERTWYYKEEELEMAGLRSAVRGLTAVSFTGEQPTQKEEISLTIYLDNENDPEVSIRLYRHDGDRCIAVVDGKATAFVERAKVVDLIEAVQNIVLEEQESES